MAAKISKTTEGWSFRCPGCGDTHSLSSQIWSFNGNFEAPTFRASVLVTTGCYTAGHKPGDRCWCVYNAEQREKGEPEAPFKCRRCHSYVTDGQIQFLGDCTHALVGQTVPLPDWEQA
jgi:hypothetical protein